MAGPADYLSIPSCLGRRIGFIWLLSFRALLGSSVIIAALLVIIRFPGVILVLLPLLLADFF
jgi:hypothetical protein